MSDTAVRMICDTIATVVPMIGFFALLAYVCYLASKDD